MFFNCFVVVVVVLLLINLRHLPSFLCQSIILGPGVDDLGLKYNITVTACPVFVCNVLIISHFMGNVFMV